MYTSVTVVIEEWNMVSVCAWVKGWYQGVCLERLPHGLRDAGGSVQSGVGDLDKRVPSGLGTCELTDVVFRKMCELQGRSEVILATWVVVIFMITNLD